ncbi:hypothetical protein V6N13_086199 [Hibiscus sabdariffa]
MGGTKGIGWTGYTMGTEWRAGAEGVYTEGNIDKDLGFTGFTQGTLILVNGIMARVMALVFKLVLIGVAMLGNSSPGLNMDLVTIISGMEINIVENILETKFMDSEWHEGRKQGYGMYTFRSGDAKCGEWDYGTLRTPLPPLTDAILRAVQDARKTAANAIKQVNKVVLAANRAATAARVAAVRAVQNRMDGKFCDTIVYKTKREEVRVTP